MSDEHIYADDEKGGFHRLCISKHGRRVALELWQLLGFVFNHADLWFCLVFTGDGLKTHNCTDLLTGMPNLANLGAPPPPCSLASGFSDAVRSLVPLLAVLFSLVAGGSILRNTAGCIHLLERCVGTCVDTVLGKAKWTCGVPFNSGA